MKGTDLKSGRLFTDKKQAVKFLNAMKEVN